MVYLQTIRERKEKRNKHEGTGICKSKLYDPQEKVKQIGSLKRYQKV